MNEMAYFVSAPAILGYVQLVRVRFSRSVWVGEADRVAVTYR